MIDFEPTEEQRRLIESVARFARERLGRGTAVRDRERAFALDEWRAAGELRIHGLPVDESWGGAGLDPLSCALVLETLGRECADRGLLFSIGAHLCSVVVPIWRHGSETQRARWLPALAGGTAIGAGAITEPGSGSDAFALATRAERDGDGFRLNGSKAFVTNAPVADVLLVFACTDARKRAIGGITAFLVDARAPGVRISPATEMMGLRTSAVGEVGLDDVRVGPDAVVGGLGGGTLLFTEAMDWERTLLFASAVGAIESLLERAVAHARRRVQFGQPIGKFQAVSHRIADVKVKLEAGRLLTYKAAWSLGRRRHASLDASIAKLFVSESLVEVALDVLRVHGGAGYESASEIERELRDAVAGTIYSGTSDVQRNLVAGWLGL